MAFVKQWQMHNNNMSKIKAVALLHFDFINGTKLDTNNTDFDGDGWVKFGLCWGGRGWESKVH